LIYQELIMDDTVKGQEVSEILIVDDAPAHAQMLSVIFKRDGYKTKVALSGKTALESVRNNPPDLLLLDINMPEMDGYEVCRRLKADEKLKGIPVIFLSSVTETPDKVKAFNVGGCDYVEKPFQVEEIRARVGTHLKIRNLQHGLFRQNQRLEEIVSERTRQLAEAYDQLAIMDSTKDEFLNLISHELRTPLNGIFGAADLLFDENESDPARNALIEIFKTSRKNMMLILDDALLLTQIKISDNKFSSQTNSLGFILEEAISALGTSRPGSIILNSETAPSEVNVQGDALLLVKAFSSLFETALKFSSGEPATVSCRKTSVSAEIKISARGRTIPDSLIPNFFDVFTVSKPIKDVGELGLGPPLAQRIISLFGGSLVVRNDEPSGISFIATCRSSME
jgi:two-component system sensor histidine kinase/response regulator